MRGPCANHRTRRWVCPETRSDLPGPLGIWPLRATPRPPRAHFCPGTHLIFLPRVLLAAWSPWPDCPRARPQCGVSLIFVLRSLCDSGIGWHSPFRSRLPLPATDPLSPSLPLPSPLSLSSDLLIHTLRGTWQNRICLLPYKISSSTSLLHPVRLLPAPGRESLRSSNRYLYHRVCASVCMCVCVCVCVCVNSGEGQRQLSPVAFARRL